MSNRRSLQNRLIISAVLTVIVLGAISNYVAYRVVNYRLTRAFDDALESKAKALLSLTKVEKDGNIEIEFASDSMPEYASRVSPEYFLIISERGEVLARSPSLAAADVARMPQKHFTSQRAFDHPLPDGRMGRVLVFQGSPIVEKDSEEEWQPADPNAASLGDPLWVVVARERAPLDRSLRHVAI
ncbi:MAG: sensor histidine kinase N-terminal domain-containing protein, partial [Candidatus Sumerlaeaceae bacterium]|nr:sensor histidine kinase N-terminal domain-containing protein [Candidatus Sumerlaeaceae bacterium]